MVKMCRNQVLTVSYSELQHGSDDLIGQGAASVLHVLGYGYCISHPQCDYTRMWIKESLYRPRVNVFSATQDIS